MNGEALQTGRGIRVVGLSALLAMAVLFLPALAGTTSAAEVSQRSALSRTPAAHAPTALSADSTGWVIQATPKLPPGSNPLELDAVSCPSSTACIAVGGYVTASEFETSLAERWNGTRWATQSTPIPTDAEAVGDLSGVSCSSAEACTAVGFYENSSGYVTLADRWNGTHWTIEPTTNPSGVTFVTFTPVNELQAVSCPSSNSCTAVGYYFNQAKVVYETLAEHWNGISWRTQSTPNPSGTTKPELDGVSCSSSTACTAVGSYPTSGGTKVLAERWNGTRWVIQSTPKVPSSPDNEFAAVSCSSTTACTAVGSSSKVVGSRGALVTLAERWNGTRWTIQSTVNPSRTPPPSDPHQQLFGVSCPSAATCTAVGIYSQSCCYLTLAERWNGTRWTIQSTPNPPHKYLALPVYLLAVSCRSVTTCTAVGEYNTAQATLAEHD